MINPAYYKRSCIDFNRTPLSRTSNAARTRLFLAFNYKLHCNRSRDFQ